MPSEAHHAEQQNGEHDLKLDNPVALLRISVRGYCCQPLQQQHKNDEIQRLHWTDDHDQNGRLNRTDERA